ncbi:cytochrome b/b6 domain-containing protein [Shewanella gelidii]|uniref:Cytochrome b561 n=1 Tax=Shewanella gelidii TaxID=1642821 RepID=A0A917JID1_9GAMM|nr:cytochrome b/b6 domain-containing protein [Shewanella gelidii]MCL1096842.1 cytochrome b/b6 domain-containing protein [Shewanella gelidii]GGI70552.1 cytochrome b561 [Shewanella gelidii]
MVRVWLNRLSELQHLALLLLTSYLIITSNWILIGRALRDNASIWDTSHVYLGLVTAVLSTTFLIRNCIRGKWRQYFTWLAGDFSQVKQDIIGCAKGKIPVAGGKGLYSVLEGIGMLLLFATGLTGTFWFLAQGTADAMLWRGYHVAFAQGFIGFLILHFICACLHVADFIRH